MSQLPAPGARAVGHPSAWLAWTASAASAALLMRNPWYLLLLGGAAVAVRWRLTRRAPTRSAVLLLASLVITSTLVNVLFSRAGDTVLLHLRLGWLGGPYTLEAVLFGAAAGLQIAVVFLVMMVFGVALTPADLLRRTPPGLYAVGVASTLGLTFAPLARRSFQDLAEARRVRGLRAQGVREARASIEPLVILSLERALAQAEALTARGWAAGTLDGGRRALALAGWVGIAAGLGLWAVQPASPGWGIALVALALVALAAAVRGTRARYQPDVWTWPDRLVVILSAAALALLMVLMTRAPELLTYYPYPLAYLPGLHPAPVAVVLLLTGPILRRGRG